MNALMSNQPDGISNINTPVDFANDNFTGAIFTNMNSQNNVDFTNANFTNANFNNSSWNGLANVGGVTWSNTTCPDGSNSDNNGGTCVGFGF